MTMWTASRHSRKKSLPSMPPMDPMPSMICPLNWALVSWNSLPVMTRRPITRLLFTSRVLIAVENIVWQEVDKYITGQEPIENYDKVIEAAKAAGATEMEEIYNAAWDAALGK